MSHAPIDPSDEPVSFDLLVVQAMREHGEALRPDAPSRERIWKRIEKGMAAGQTKEGFERWLQSLLGSPRRWAPVLLVTLAAAIGLPLLMDSSTEPDWNSVEFKGGATLRLKPGQRADFIAGLRQRGVSFGEAPQEGAAAIAIRPDEQQKLDAQFRQAWRLPVSGKAPLIVIFE